MPLAKELGLTEDGGYILSFNGGRIIECKTGETVFAKELPVTSNKRIIALAREHGVNILTYEGDCIITPDPGDIYVKRSPTSINWRSGGWKTSSSTWISRW